MKKNYRNPTSEEMGRLVKREIKKNKTKDRIEGIIMTKKQFKMIKKIAKGNSFLSR